VFGVNNELQRVEWVSSVGKKYPDCPIRSTRAQFALFGVWRGQYAEAGICRCTRLRMTRWNFDWRLLSETPSTRVVAPISFFCLSGQGADHARNLSLWNLPKAEVWGVAFAPVSE
jgi:hypothetical protein